MKNLIILLLSFPLISQEIVNETIKTQVGSSQASAELQIQIDELDVESKKIYFEYKDTLNEYNSLKSYDDQLSQIIDAQVSEMKSINEQIDSLDDVNIDILPLLKRMVDALNKDGEIFYRSPVVRDLGSYQDTWGTIETNEDGKDYFVASDNKASVSDSAVSADSKSEKKKPETIA